jgi:lipid A 4'-phosphatase
MNGRLAFAVVTGLAAILFSLFPQIDLWVSGLFYRPDAGFFLGSWLPVRVIYRAVPIITYATLLFAVISVLAGFLGRKRLLGCDGRAVAYLVLALAIGPGFLANTVLKDHWGRARPSQVTEFGGAKNFTPALDPPIFEPAVQCERNCSFVSGHAALGFYLVSFAFLVPLPRRRYAIAAALALGGLFGIARIAQGGHFLSDVVFAGILVFATSWLLHRIVIVNGLRAPRLSRRALVGTALAALAIVLCVMFVDRPAARFFHDQSDAVHEVFQFITLFGLSKWYLIGAALLWLGLHVAPRLPPFQSAAKRLEAWSYLPLYFFVSVAASGLAVDLIKILVGRTRPKLLFADDQFAFTGLASRADHWSFPSGHTANVVAIAITLTTIWSRLLPVAVVFAGLVAASRVIITAHYVSDVVMGAYIAVMVTRYVEFVFAQSGVPVAAAKAGSLPSRPKMPWRDRFGLPPRGASFSDSL